MDIDALGIWYVDVPVIPPTGVTITGDDVFVAFLQSGKPKSGDWHAAVWAVNESGQNVARILVGPGNIVLSPGTWYEWVKVVDSPETPVFCAGSVEVR